MIRRALLFALAAVTCNVATFAQSCPPVASWCSGTYAYDAMGNVRAIGADTYIYDTAGRLLSGTADVQRTGLVSQQDYTYDAFGNRTGASRISGSVDCLGGCELSPTIEQTTNHISGSGAQYDAAGNLTFIQGTNNASYTYDAAGSLVRAVAGTDDRQFLYTADDERIATANGASWTWTVRGLDGKVLREFTSYQPPGGLPISNWQWTKDYVWRDGQLLASVTPTGSGGTATQHFHLDHLGTPRLVTGNNGVQLSVHAYYPFGVELNLTPSEQPAELMKFTGHERDLLANDPHTLDYMHARYEMGAMGRFLSVDPVLGTAVTPQSWNRYSYVRNAPITLTDPSGQCGEGDSFVGPIQPCDATVNAQNPSDLEYRLTMANIAAVDNLRYSGMFLDWVARDLSAPFLMFAQTVHSDHLTPAALGLLSNAMVAMGPIDPEGEIAAAADAAKEGAEEGVVDATIHGATRLAGRGGADGPWTATEIALTKTGMQTTQRGGGQVFIKEVAPGRFNVIVETQTGRVITAMRTISFKSVQRLARNYGWVWP
jgi:RHS repeat-associated protein